MKNDKNDALIPLRGKFECPDATFSVCFFPFVAVKKIPE